jgi:hypothetical protein
MKILFVTICAFALAASAQAEPVDPFALHIEIGRWGVMTDTVDELLSGGDVDADPTSPQALARGLREAVWSFNLARETACAAGKFTALACGAAYLPAWLGEAGNISPSLETLQARSDEVGAVVMPFWGAVCDDAQSRVADEEERLMVCPME